MQLICIEFVCYVLGFEGVNLVEFVLEIKYFIIDIMCDQIDVEDMGGIFCLGFYLFKLKCGFKAAAVYYN